MQFSHFIFSFLLVKAINGEQDIVLDPGQLKVTISCPDVTKWINPFGDTIDASSNPIKYKISGENLTINRIGEHDVGKYYCKVGEIRESVNVYAPPFIKPLEKSVNVVQGTPVHVVCSGWGYPTPKFNWSRVMPDSSLVLLSGTTNLTINSTVLDDYGIYMCSASNIYGTANQTTKIRVKDKLAPLWPFIGIVIEVIVLVVIIIIYEKRKHKNEPDNGSKSK